MNVVNVGNQSPCTLTIQTTGTSVAATVGNGAGVRCVSKRRLTKQSIFGTQRKRMVMSTPQPYCLDDLILHLQSVQKPSLVIDTEYILVSKADCLTCSPDYINGNQSKLESPVNWTSRGRSKFGEGF